MQFVDDGVWVIVGLRKRIGLRKEGLRYVLRI